MRGARLTLVYACSGCSSAAQMANHLAVRMDRAGVAEMSCIAGVGGGVRPLVRLAREAGARGRPILAIDGCRLECVRHSLASAGVEPTHHLQLAEHGVRKTQHADFDSAEAQALFDAWVPQVRALNALWAGAAPEPRDA